ncbi:MAG TPA: PBP1A family penicillin-binding protein [Gemmatimonadaceae bacterium]|nr:PBP1A family penicillin-binding protein [Gemmatimonadaceae bacterium]
MSWMRPTLVISALASLTLGACLLTAAPLAAQGTTTGTTTGAASEPWRIVALPQSSLVYARDGSLIGEIGREWRTSVAIRSLPRYLPLAFIAVEDQRFYQHDGVDLIGVASAIKGKVLGERRGGASTITQQLVGNMHPELIDRREQTIERKVREQMAAREMEKRYSKEQVLEAYLNTINFGRGWYGVEAASRHYFGKPAARLTVAEAASLAALPKSPVGYDPIRFPEKNRQRRNLIIDLMVEQRLLDGRAAAKAKAEPVRTVPGNGMAVPSGYFVDAVRQTLERAGVPVSSGGFRVHTTLDPALQREAVAALVEGTAKIEARPGYKRPTMAKAKAGSSDYLQGMVVAMDPATGDVRALVGGRNHAIAPFNRATLALRQPGSSFKPFVYATALEAGLVSAVSVVPDTAIAVPLQNGRLYRPTNADDAFLGDLTLRDALAKSRNPVAVQLGLLVGMDSVAALAKRFGLDTPVAPYPASALGASVVRPVDFVAAWTAFANDGAVVDPRYVTRVEDARGQVVWQRPAAPPRPVVDPRVAFIVRDMLRTAAEQGTGAPARRLVGAQVPVAGKTGTTNDNADVWFVGMTPDLVAAVWLGFDKPRTIAAGAAGSTLAAPIWGQMVGRWYGGRAPQRSWTPPADLIAVDLDRATRTVADALTPPERRYTEYFLPGTEPEPLRSNPWKLPRWGAVLGEP